MSTQWQLYPLSALLAEIVDNRGKTAPTADTGIPLIATNCISNNALYPKYERVRYVSEETYRTWFRAHPKPGDIIFVNKGTPGLVCLVPDPVDFCIAQDMVALRPNRDLVDGEYLFAVLRSPLMQEQIANLHVGTLIPHVKKGDFDKILIPLPSMEVQEIIGRTYTDFCRMIDINRRMNAVLETTILTLFKSWFIDFDPIHAKSGNTPLTLPERMMDLFPNAVGGEAIEIALMAGWRIQPIGDIADIVGGSTPSTKVPAYWEEGIHYWATPKDLSNLDVPVLLETERYITETGLSQISSGLLPKGTVLLSSRAPIGYLAIAEIPVAINQGFIAMKPKQDVSSLFLLFWAKLSHDEILSRANGSTFLEISKSNFRPIELVVPPVEIMKEFDRIARPLYERIVENERESRSLSVLRDALLPRLISGELRG